MARTVSTATRQDLLEAGRTRYQGSLKREKLRILDELVAITGYHRKHVIRLCTAAAVAPGQGRRARLPVYDEAVRAAIIVLYQAQIKPNPHRRPLHVCCDIVCMLSVAKRRRRRERAWV